MPQFYLEHLICVDRFFTVIYYHHDLLLFNTDTLNLERVKCMSTPVG